MESLDDINEKDYAGKIKNRCFICEAHIDNNWDYYLVFGNCCRACNTRIGKKKKMTEPIKINPN